MTLNPTARFTPHKPIRRVVRKEGPAPRAALMMRLDAVKTAPRISGGLTEENGSALERGRSGNDS